MPFIERAGRFRASINSFALEASKSSKSVGLWCRFALIAEWSVSEKTWHEMNGLDETTGTAWFIGRDGATNPRGIATLKDSLGWDGNADSLAGATDWKPANCQVVVEEEEYEGKKKFKAKWINPWEGDGQPSAKGVTASKLEEIKNILGGKVEIPF